MPRITVYGKPNCQQCTATKSFLNARQIRFVYVDVRLDYEAAQHIMALGYKGVPVVQIDGGLHWGGFRDDKLRELAQLIREQDHPDGRGAVDYLTREED